MSSNLILRRACLARSKRGRSNSWVRHLIMSLAIALVVPSALSAQSGAAPCFILKQTALEQARYRSTSITFAPNCATLVVDALRRCALLSKARAANGETSC